jgi:hypothetical protein
MSRPNSRRGGLSTLVKTLTGKTQCSQPVGSISDQFPTRGTSPDKSPPRTTSLRPARVSLDSDWGVGHDTRRDPKLQTSLPRRLGDRFPAPCKHTSWRLMQAAGPDKSLNVGLLCCTAIPSPSSLCHTQASPEALKHPLRQALARA